MGVFIIYYNLMGVFIIYLRKLLEPLLQQILIIDTEAFRQFSMSARHQVLNVTVLY
ncbi:MAG: hypothetical protein ACI84K_001416 [Pseudohongiellaceae bacterium]|jgi:hypothetical protein